ncbi:MAG: c-type cytochrome domain-containing protein [Microscillaceae bacterium]|nr:c-type cytochrome domain-containing protein [Microscillaceae bacterium]
MLLDTNWGLFIGRFHPLLVHLPIGFLLLAVLLEFLSRKYTDLRRAAFFIWMLGAWSALATVICGWFLAAQGGYEADTLFWHRWMGILMTIFTFLIWSIKAGWFALNYRSIPIFAGFVLILVLLTGHLGGNLTHGSDYLLQYAPGFVQKMLGYTSVNKKDTLRFSNPDSVLVFQQLIQPILDEKCLSCHNKDKMKGGLLLDSKENLLKGGDHGAVLASGKSFESELIKRITLPGKDPLFMPPKGEPLSYSQIKLLEWWINAGTSFDKKISDYAPLPVDLQVLLLKEYALDTRQKSYLEKTSVKSIPANQIKKIQEKGFQVSKITQENGFLEVSFSSKKTLDKAALESLLAAKNQITWLNLGKSGIQDDMISILTQLPNLTRLRLEDNPISDQGIAQLQKLEHLESLNIYKTKISEQSLEHLKKLPSLKRLYLWQTEVSAGALENLKKELPHVEIDTGFQFVKKASESLKTK